MENNLNSGLLITDVSDDLTVFVIDGCECKSEKKENIIKYKQLRTEERKTAFKGELKNYNWKLMYEEKNIDKASEYLLGVFKSLCEKKITQ